MTPEQFWGSTLHEFRLQIDGYKARERKLDYRNAILCTMIARLGGNKRVKPDDFMPKDKRSQKMTDDQMLRQVEMLNAFFGGKDTRKGVVKK